MCRPPRPEKMRRAALADGPKIAKPGSKKHARVYSVSPETQVAIYTLLPIVLLVGLLAAIGGRP
jgi:hypothetical protein